jgi:hypothetical protein
MLCLLLVGKTMKRRKEKEKRSDWGLFSQGRAGHTLLAVMGRIFVAIRCN